MSTHFLVFSTESEAATAFELAGCVYQDGPQIVNGQRMDVYVVGIAYRQTGVNENNQPVFEAKPGWRVNVTHVPAGLAQYEVKDVESPDAVFA